MASLIKYLSLSSGDVLPFSIIDEGAYMNADYDVESVIQLINSPIVIPKFRIFVLYPDETIAYEIPNKDIVSGGNYSENYQDGQRRSLSFSLYNFDGKYTSNINQLWAGTKLRLEQGIETPGGTTIWFMKGVYVVTHSVPSRIDTGYTVQITAADKFALFENNTGLLDTTYEIPVGAEIESVIKEILLTDMRNGDPFDPKSLIYHSSFKGKTVQCTISKSAGDTYGSILLDLAAQLSAEIFYNAMGHLTLIPIVETSLDYNKPLIYSFNSEKGDITGLSFDFNLNDIVNAVIVIGSSVNGTVHRAKAENRDVSSPLCVQRIGARTGSIINDSNITTDLLAQERADYELRKQLILKTTSNVTVVYNPLLDVNNLISITDDFFNLNNEKFLLQSVSCSLDYSGQMNISISNIKNLPFITQN